MAGFEPRGTEISKRMMTYQNLVENKGSKLSLRPLPDDIKELLELDRDTKIKYKSTKNATEIDDESGVIRRSADPEFPFCHIEDGQYNNLARIVYQSSDGSNLFTADKLHQMCNTESTSIQAHHTFPGICQVKESGHCCPSWSLANYVAFLSGKLSCQNITDDDVMAVSRLLQSCAGHYSNRSLTSNCDNSFQHTSSFSRSRSCKGVPKSCTRFNIVYNILHHITDINFVHPTRNSGKPFLTYAVTFLPVAGSISTVELYEHLENVADEMSGDVRIAGAHFGIKYTLFGEYLRSDTLFLGIAAFIIFIVVWLYTTSLFITIMTFIMMFWSLEMAYFVYTMILELVFFPYMNLVAVIIIIAIGADDVFLYSKVWHSAKSSRNNGTLEKIVYDTIKHATLSMFVTSFTTASALLTNTLSSITSIKCFSIYSALVVLCNFLLVLTWLPASIVIYDKWCNCEMWYNPEFSTHRNCCYYVCKIPFKAYEKLSDTLRIFCEKILPFLVVKFRFVWIVIFGCLGLGGVIVIFFYPKVKLPSSENFQVFSSSHLLERYDFMLNKQFWFEKVHKKHAFLPLTFVWGVYPTDDGSHLDPADSGNLVFDKVFDATSSEAQIWLLKFCQHIRKSDFYRRIPGLQITNCFFENFHNNYMSRPCWDGIEDHRPCCNKTDYKLDSVTVFECLMRYIPLLEKTNGVSYSHYSPGPRFHQGRLSAFLVQFLSNTQFSTSYDEIKTFHTTVERFLKDELTTAPKSLKNGWFVSDLGFYDLQHSLATETPIAIGVSLAVVALVTFITTLNILISLLSIISIACVMFVTISIMVLMNWELNILESVVVTVAIGLSVDYTLHYGVSYRLLPDLQRDARVATSTAGISGVISSAALTTFLAGAMMMPSTVLVYQKFGIFLMIIISISWAYSTFFFQSLLCCIGPKGSFGQYHWPSCDCCSNSAHSHVDKTVYSMSESTVSTASTYPHTSSTVSDVREFESVSESLTVTPHPTPHHHPRRSKFRGHYMKARTRSDSPELDPHCRRESHVRFSVSSIEQHIDPDDDHTPYHSKRRSRTDSVFEEPEPEVGSRRASEATAKSEITQSSTLSSKVSEESESADEVEESEKSSPIVIVYSESVT
ncbi:hypothetical protein FSP39_005755 [Pinctada imbricata]|uniref:SSD domain-containing protein n=1 Tax=Pinctada imbricata TaxID=66713 RepID=A0AA88XYL5_PINIB|nr:hypothetical protein FSP39_005755 [Pinctada imbricata]